MTDYNHTAGIKFSIEEAVWFRTGEEIADLISLSVEPDVTVQDLNHFISIHGALKMYGEYKKDTQLRAEPVENFYFSGQKYVTVLETREEGVSEFHYDFPVDITIPKSRVRNVEELDIVIDFFDYTIPDKDCLKLIAKITVAGIESENATVLDRSNLVDEPNDVEQDEQVESFDDRLVPLQDVLEHDELDGEETFSFEAKKVEERVEDTEDTQIPIQVISSNEEAFVEIEQGRSEPEEEYEFSFEAGGQEGQLEELTNQTSPFEPAFVPEQANELSSELTRTGEEKSDTTVENENHRLDVTEEVAEEKRLEDEVEKIVEHVTAKSASNNHAEVTSDAQVELGTPELSTVRNESQVQNEDDTLERATVRMEKQVQSQVVVPEPTTKAFEAKLDLKPEKPAPTVEFKTNQQEQVATPEPFTTLLTGNKRGEESTPSQIVVTPTTNHTDNTRDVNEQVQDDADNTTHVQPEVAATVTDLSAELAREETVVVHEDSTVARSEEYEREEQQNESVVDENVEERKEKSINYQSQVKKDDEKSISLTQFFGRKEEERTARMKIYLVQQEDTLSLIAEKYDVSVSQLLRLNHLEPHHDVYDGQVLYIPVNTEKSYS